VSSPSCHARHAGHPCTIPATATIILLISGDEWRWWWCEWGKETPRLEPWFFAFWWRRVWKLFIIFEQDADFI
jgi:hypothetical protein